MSSINPTDFENDSLNIKIIEGVLLKEQYKKLYYFLKKYFEKEPYITAKDIQTEFIIHNYSRAFQLLDSFVILNLLEKKKHRSTNRTLFIRSREDFWDLLGKKIKEELK